MSLPKKGKFSQFHFNKSVNLMSWTQIQTSRGSQEGKLNLSVINKLEDYRKTMKAKLDDGDHEKIKDKLELEEIAGKRLEKRMKTNQNYLNYKRNPFVIKAKNIQDIFMREENEVQTQRNQNKVLNGEKEETPKKYEIIVDALNNLKNKLSKNHFKNILQKPKRKVEEIDLKSLLPKKKKQKKSKVRNQNQQFAQKMQIYMQKQIDPFAELVAIQNIKQEDFFSEKLNKTPINLFSVIFMKQNNQLIDQSRQELSKFHFSQDSLINQPDKKFSLEIGEHISTLQRQDALQTGKLKRKRDKQHKELNLEIQKINFQDIMGVACGKIDSQGLYSYLKGLNQMKASEFQPKELNMSLKSKQKNASINSILKENQGEEITSYKQEPFNKSQKKQIELSEFYMQKLQKLLKEERSTVIENRIAHKNFLQKINFQKNQTIEDQFNFVVNKNIQLKDTQKLIRMNKSKKDRSINLKNTILLSTLINKRIYQNASKSKSRSKGKTFNWR